MTSLTLPKTSSFRSLQDLRGIIEPRIFTEPLRDLDDPRATYGHAAIAFAERVCGAPLDPWQQVMVRRAGELDENGLPRFRQVLTIVARQNGKSFALRVLAAFWLFAQRHALVVGVANKLDIARESWAEVAKLARSVPALDRRLEVVKTGNGKEEIRTTDGCRYLLAAAGSNAARGLTVNRAVWDEVRSETDYETHASLEPTMAAVADAQLFMISNMGHDQSMVLNDTRSAALSGATGIGLLEWSAEPGLAPDDPQAWIQANPNVGRRVLVTEMASAAARAVMQGGEPLARFRVERLCQRVSVMDPAVDPMSWDRCLERGDLGHVRDRVVLAFDMSPDLQHVTVVAAAVLPDDRVRVEPLSVFDGQGAGHQLRRQLPAIIAKVRPRVVGWLPGGPSAGLMDAMKPRQGWPPAGVTVQEIRSEQSAICMAFSEAVSAGQIVHSGDPLLDAHVKSAERLRRGDAWVFSRKGGHCDAAYAAAAAAFLARTMPIASGKPRIHFYGIPD